jgi:hypothetical protein
MTVQNNAIRKTPAASDTSTAMSTGSTTVAHAQHSEPNVTLYGRIAAGPVGDISWPDPPDLYFPIVIDDAYNGITVLDGQPTLWEGGIRNMALIRTHRYENSTPNGVRGRMPLRATQLAVHVMAWTASIPALSVLLAALDRHGTLPLPKHIVGTSAIALVAWAAWIYWRRIPPSVRLLERSIRFAIFVLTMLAAAVIALYAAFWSIVAIYGL